MRRKHRGSKKRARALHDKHSKPSNMELRRNEGVGDDADERRLIINAGKCEKGICGPEAACSADPKRVYTCFCPSDKLPPTKDLRCPTNATDRQQTILEGKCTEGICGPEAQCGLYTGQIYYCICPYDKRPPTKDFRCPERIISAPSDSRPIPLPNWSPPSNQTNGEGNKTNTLRIQTTAGPIVTSERDTKLVLVTSGVAFLTVACFIVFLVIYIKGKFCGSRNKNSSSPSPIMLKRNLLVADRYAPNPQYTAFTSTTVPVLKREAIHFITEIGEGCFGKVYKGELFDDSDEDRIVAVKVLKGSATKETEDDFLREVDIMSAFKHCNILSLLGVVLRDSTAGPMMVFEYMPHGDLVEVLRKQKRQLEPDEQEVPFLKSRDLLLIAVQIASGMKYLAAQRFVHRDLACRNCLVSDGPTVKIADFGMSRDVYTCDYYKIGGSRMLPVRWMSPESVKYGRFTLESDVWSYGIVLWEIYSFGKQPYYGHSNEEVVRLILQDIILSPEDCPPFICDLMRQCWKTEPRDRIKFAAIHDRLSHIYENELEFSVVGSLKKLPRPPPLPTIIPTLDIIDSDGYLQPKETTEKVYLETLPD